jgi:hypothetical protein
MMMGAEISVVGVLDGPRDFSPNSKTVVSSGCWSGTISYDLVTSKDPCWSSFFLSGGEGGFSVTGDRPKILCDRWISLSSTV